VLSAESEEELKEFLVLRRATCSLFASNGRECCEGKLELFDLVDDDRRTFDRLFTCAATSPPN
jgi:hypothetical protein